MKDEGAIGRRSEEETIIGELYIYLFFFAFLFLLDLVLLQQTFRLILIELYLA